MSFRAEHGNTTLATRELRGGNTIPHILCSYGYDAAVDQSKVKLTLFVETVPSEDASHKNLIFPLGFQYLTDTKFFIYKSATVDWTLPCVLDNSYDKMKSFSGTVLSRSRSSFGATRGTLPMYLQNKPRSSYNGMI